MEISSLRLLNYKSIEDSGVIDLSRRINIFAGKNNTGKTALIEAVYNVVNASFVDLLPNSPIPNETKLEIEITIDDTEINILNRGMRSEYFINEVNRLKIYMSFFNLINNSIIKRIEVFKDDTYFQIYENKSSNNYPIDYVFYNITGDVTSFGGRPESINNFIDLLKDRIVFISGTRHVPKEERTIVHNSLSIDATNLNAFLYTLHNNDERVFDQIINIFKKIFNDITSVSTPIDKSSNTYISLYFEGNSKSIPLSNCGSGFTHVLILLCVLFTKERRVVLFDEPHVFLHPSAEKAIYDLINETKNHQYLLTTHSPLLINYPFSKNIFLVQKKMGKSYYSQLSNIEEILLDIGLSNSDFALADKVIFVEGETEEAVIPLILDHFGIKQIGYNYRILKMNGTGNEFIKKSVMRRNKDKLDLVLGGISKSPIPYKIVIDSDEKTESKILEIKEKYGDNVLILERREIENYFLDCYEEISTIINIDTGKDISNGDDIKSILHDILSNKLDRKLFPRVATNSLKDAVGSEALKRLFTKYNLTYNKIIHGKQLTRLILQENSDRMRFFIDELGDFFVSN